MSAQQSDIVLPRATVRRRLLSEQTLINLLRFALLAALLGFWQFASGPLIPPFFVSSPSAILARLSTWIANGQLFFHMGITAAEAALGFLCGSVCGIAAGVLLGRREFLAKLLDPFIMTIYSLPKIALAPLFILWIGIGMDMKVIFTAMIVFFLVFLNTYTGVRNVSRELISILHLMGANERQVLHRVVLPSAITWVFAGLKISVPYALIGAIVGELMASNKGLGALLVRAQGEFDTAGVFAALAAIMFLAIMSNGLVKLAERKLMPWKEVENQREGAV
jgi:NitT/TauT family transport system permease protein